MAFDPDAYLANLESRKKSGVKFKNSQVGDEFANESPELQDVVYNSPEPLVVTSGRRSPETNAAVGGVPNSAHLSGYGMDLRRNLKPETLSYLQNSGLKVLDEGDHYHVEPKTRGSVKPIYNIANFDPDAYLKSRGLDQEPQSTESQPDAPKFTPSPNDINAMMGMKSSAPQKLSNEELTGLRGAENQDIPITPEILDAAKKRLELRGGGGMFDTGLTNWANNVSLGGFSKGVAGLESIFPSLQEEGGNRSFKENLAIEKAIQNLRNQENPGSAFIGQLGGTFTPGGATSLIGKAAKGAGVAFNAKRGLDVARPILSKAIPYGLEGAASGAAMEAANPNADAGTIAKAAMIGAPLNIIGAAVSEGVKRGAGALGNIGKSLSEQAETGVLGGKLQGFEEKSIPFLGGAIKGGREAKEKLLQEAFEKAEAERRGIFDATEAQRLASHKAEQEAAKSAIGGLPKADAVTAGEGLQSALKTSREKLGQEYAKLADPVLEKFGESKIAPDLLSNQVSSFLKKQGMMAEDGSLLLNELEKVQSPHRKQMLSNLVDLHNRMKAPGSGLPTEISINELNRIKEDLGSIVKNFDSLTSSPEQGVYKSLYKTAKRSIDEGLTKVAPGEDAQALQQARSIYAKKMPLFDELKGLYGKNPEAIITGAKGKLPGSFVEGALQTHPELREPIANVVLNNITKNVSTPQMLTRRINDFGRPTLKKLLGNEQFAALEAAEKRFLDSKTAFAPNVFIPGNKPTVPLGPINQKIVNYAKGLKDNRFLKFSNQPIGDTHLILPLLGAFLQSQKTAY